MTQFTDKPKRKRTPRRRHKFLLMIIVPIVALIVGFMAVLPQIDAWLATDPFTPQCHFEENRYVYAGSIVDVNGTQVWDVPDSLRLYAWSPDGTAFAYFSRGAQGSELHRLDLEIGDDQHINYGDNLIGLSLEWSPDSQSIALAFITQNDQSVTLIVADNELSSFRQHPIASVHDMVWSPDGQHLMIEQALGQDDDPDLILTIESGQQQSLRDLPDYDFMVNWLSNTEILYQTQSRQLFVYDIGQQTSELWVDAYLEFGDISPDRRWISAQNPNTGDRWEIYDLTQGNTPIFNYQSLWDGQFVDHFLRFSDENNTDFYNLRTHKHTVLPAVENDKPNQRSHWTKISPLDTYATYESFSGRNRYEGFNFVQSGTQESVTMPADWDAYPQWVVLDGEEWLPHFVTSDTQTRIYLINPDQQHMCKIQVLEGNSIFLHSLQPELQG